MSTKINKLNFDGQTIFVGIDVHKKQWTVSIIAQGIQMMPYSQDPSPQVLVKRLHKLYPRADYKAVYEAGFCGFWIQKQLMQLGVDCIVVHPADVPSTHLEKSRKTDKRDSEKLARNLSNGNLKAIYIPEQNQLLLRELMRTRRQVVTDQTRTKNRIKSALKMRGINSPISRENWSKAYIKWLATFEQENYPDIYYHLQNLIFIRQQLKDIEVEIRKAAKLDLWAKQVQLLESIPGINYRSALVLLSEIGDMSRFKRLDTLCSYVGIVPNCHSSGDKDRTGRMTKRGNKILKTTIIESAWVAIRNDPALTQKYAQLKARGLKASNAIVRIAKKLLNRIRYVLNKQQPYEIGLVQ